MPSRPPAVARVLERVTETVRTHEMFGRGDLVVASVSGGPDSVCLVHALWFLRRLFGIRLAVFHLDHRLRPGSDADAAYVRRLSGRLGLPFHHRAAEDRPVAGESVELWARYERIRAIGDVVAEIGADRWADGHTVDDQAETVLMGLVLGWGLDGLGGIAPVNGAQVRPLLDVTREEVLAFCRSLHLRPRIDPSNADPRFLRNALRLEAIPAIERATGRSVRHTFARTADLLRADAELLGRLADEHADALIEPTSDGFRLPARELAALPPPLASRVVRRALRASGTSWTAEAIEAIRGLAGARPGQRRDLAGGWRAIRERGHVRVAGPATLAAT